MKTIHQAYEIKASPERVFKALTDVKDIKVWSGAGTHFEAKEGGAYSMWDGWVKGKVIELVPSEKVVQTWEPSDWEKQAEESVVIFKLRPKGEGTEVTLDHTNVPDEQYKGTSDGWNSFYLGSIKEYLENE